MTGTPKTVGVLIPMRGEGPSGPPESLPIGRAALHLKAEGIELLFGDQASDGAMSGAVAEPGRWRTVGPRQVEAVYDRYPSQKEEAAHLNICDQLAGVPIGNPRSMTLLCRDKLKSQRLLEGVARMPEVLDDFARFKSQLPGYGAGFLKPRYGAFGRGVTRVVPGDAIPARGEGAIKGSLEPMLLQAAVVPPPGVAGISVRVLASRLVDGGWMTSPGVARVSDTDPVVNVSRGAVAFPADDRLSRAAQVQIEQMIEASTALLSSQPEGDLLLELGFDFVIDSEGMPWMIEVNSRPRGRVELLASRWPERYGAAHLTAVSAPIRYLASLS